MKSGEKILFLTVSIFILLAVIAYIALETYRLTSEKPIFETKTSFIFSKEGKVGSRLFREARCTSCHRALRNGTNMGLSLDGVGSYRTLDWLVRFLADPEAVYGSPTLDHGATPKEAAYVALIPEADRHAIAVFISELKAEQGSVSAPVPPEGRSEFIDDMVKMWAPKDWGGKYRDIREQDESTVED